MDEVKNKTTYSCYVFLSPNDSILREFTELNIMVTWERMPEDNSSNILRGCLIITF